MNLNIKEVVDIKKIAETIASSINEKLELGKSVLLLFSGGSAIPLEIEIVKRIKENFENKLVVSLVDERYGPVGHPNSNWATLKNKGFDILNAKKIPVLEGENINITILDFKEILKNELERADYKVGVFGMGIDGHTAGILPHSEAIHSEDLVCYYSTLLYDRITITPKVISQLDEAFAYVMGEEKWGALENLEKDLSTEEQPAQLLKKVPLLTIFTDYTP